MWWRLCAVHIKGYLAVSFIQCGKYIFLSLYCLSKMGEGCFFSCSIWFNKWLWNYTQYVPLLHFSAWVQVLYWVPSPSPSQLSYILLVLSVGLTWFLNIDNIKKVFDKQFFVWIFLGLKKANKNTVNLSSPLALFRRCFIKSVCSFQSSVSQSIRTQFSKFKGVSLRFGSFFIFPR